MTLIATKKNAYIQGYLGGNGAQGFRSKSLEWQTATYLI